MHRRIGHHLVRLLQHRDVAQHVSPRPYVETTTSWSSFGTTIHVTGAAGSPALNGVHLAPSSIE